MGPWVNISLLTVELEALCGHRHVLRTGREVVSFGDPGFGVTQTVRQDL